MFSLFHFSRVFPFIHPYLFPVENRSADTASVPEPAADFSCCAASEAGSQPWPATPAEAASKSHPVNPKRLKNLYRRHQLNQRHNLTHSGALRPA